MSELGVPMHSRRGSLLPRPRLSSCGSDQEELLPRTLSYTYLNSSRQSSWSSVPGQPIPPAPCPMMWPSARPEDVKKHRMRQSGIPRPASGSSRCVVSSQHAPALSEKVLNSTALPMDKGSQPPSSWRPSPSQQMESSISYSQRKQDLSGFKEQLQIRHYSSQSLSSPGKVAASRQLLSNNDLPRSPTKASLTSPSGRDVTLRRRLMKPLSPPLPASVSCFNFPITTPSPSKKEQPPPAKPSNSKSSRVDIVGALQQSRMTKEEIDLLNQVQEDVIKNQHRSRHSFTGSQDKQRSLPEVGTTSNTFTRKSDAAVVNLSVNDIANTRRLEDQRSSGSSNRLLFINSKLANRCDTDSEVPTPTTANSAISSCPDEDWEVNLRLVHFAEPPAYWAGRYMTITSRLRQEQMNEPTTASPSSAGSSERTFESSDVRRIDMALKELQSRCRTTPALQSFKAFKTQLKGTLAVPSPTRTSAIDGTTDVDSEEEMRLRRAKKRRQQVLSSRQQTRNLGQDHTMTNPTKLEPPLPNIWSRLNMPKSKTTGNLQSLQSASTSRLPTPFSRQPRPGEWLSPHHARRASRPDQELDKRSEVLRDVRQLVKTPARIVQQRLSSAPRTPSHGSKASSKSDGKTLANSKTMPHLRKASTTVPVAERIQFARVKPFDKVSENLTCAAFETGRPPPLPPSFKRFPAAATMAGEEKQLKIRRRSQRKSSGEIIKGVFDASLKQVKQMGKRVGGSINWVGSQEDLNINVLATGTR